MNSDLRTDAIVVATILGCIAVASAIGFIVQRPAAVPAFAAMFLFISAVFALMVRIARAPDLTAKQRIRSTTGSQLLSLAVASAFASFLRLELVRSGLAPNLSWLVYCVTLPLVSFFVQAGWSRWTTERKNRLAARR